MSVRPVPIFHEILKKIFSFSIPKLSDTTAHRERCSRERCGIDLRIFVTFRSSCVRIDRIFHKVPVVESQDENLFLDKKPFFKRKKEKRTRFDFSSSLFVVYLSVTEKTFGCFAKDVRNFRKEILTWTRIFTERAVQSENFVFGSRTNRFVTSIDAWSFVDRRTF